jgi:D-aminopeptidase
MKILLDQRLDPLYEAVIEATEEAILNALCAARDLDGVNGNLVRALPLGDVRDLASAWQKQVDARRKLRGPRRTEAIPPEPATEERRDGNVVVTPAVAKPTAVRGAEGMAPPVRPAPAPPRPAPAEAKEIRPEGSPKKE